MSDMQREFELKFLASEAEMQHLRSGPALRRIGVDAPETRELTSVYFDTVDCALRSAGYTLRLRRYQDGWEQTVKEEAGPFTAAADRLESSTFVHGPAPVLGAIAPKRLRRRIEQALDGTEPAPVFKTVVQRTSQRLHVEGGGEVEIAFDEGAVRCADRSQEIIEVEIELKSGTAKSIFAVARAVFAETPLQLSQLSKAERGYRLAARSSHAQPQAKSADAPPLTPDMTAAQAFGCIVRSCSDQILGNIPMVLETEDIEGPHKLRVGLRRLRCALRAYRSLGDKAASRRLQHQARDLAKVIGELRNADVIIDEFVLPHTRNAPSERGFEALLEYLRVRRERIRETVRSHLASGEARSFQLDLCALVEAEHPAHPTSDASIGAHAGAIMASFWRKPSKLGKRIETLDVAERHEMRKSLKNLRYVIEFHAPLYPRKAVKRYLRRLAKLQDVFGFLNDVAMTRSLRKDLGEHGTDDAALDWAVGYLHGTNEVRAEVAWASARSRWKRLKRTERFWS